jgi:hypothetical protein
MGRASGRRERRIRNVTISFHQTRLLLPDPIDRVFHRSRTILKKHDAVCGDEVKVAEE